MSSVMESGMLGWVDGVPMFRQWTVETIDESGAFVNSGTRGSTGRGKSIQDWTGSFQAHGLMPARLPGEAFDFTGFLGNNKKLSGPAIVEAVSIEGSVETPGPIGNTVNFGATGPLVPGTGHGDDDAIAQPEDGVDIKIYRGATPEALTEIPDVRGFTLSLSAALGSGVSSSTAGHRRRKGGPTDLTLAIPIYADDMATLPTRGAAEVVKVEVGDVSWLLQWLRWGNRSNFIVNRETGEIIGCTLNAALTIVYGGELGQVVAPDDSIWIGEGAGS